MSEAGTLSSDAAERVLVAGIYLADRENNIVAISRELSQSKRWTVDQQWIALGRGAIPDGLAPVTVSAVESPAPKFILLFVEELDGLTARWTQFVEIGPVFSMRRDAARLLLPFDEASPMGWGYEFVWPVVIERAGLKLGIIDATPISHDLREHGAHYDYHNARQTLAEYLASRPHLSRHEAFSIIESYS